MNVAILGVDQPSFIVADMILNHYNSWLKERLGEPLNVTAFVTNLWGGDKCPAIY